MAALTLSMEDLSGNSAQGAIPDQTLESTVGPTAKLSRLQDISKSSTSSESAASQKKPGEPKDDVVVSDDIPVSSAQKKILRAERFGISVQLSEQDKRNFRAERFGGSLNKPEGGLSKPEEMKRKERAERFGLPCTSVPSDEEAKKKARHVRFEPGSKTDSLEEGKRKARALRFSDPPSKSVSQMNDKKSIQPKLAIVGKAEG